MKRGHWIALKNKYLPAILVLVLLFISCIVRGQATYRPSNTGYFTPSNKPFSPATAIPTDGRTYKADTVNGLFRPYNGTSEVLSYLPSGSQWRVGQFPVVINVGGSLQSNGLFIGGQIQVWWFLRGQADSNLVRMDSTGSGTCTTCLLKANNLSDVQSLFQTLINLNLNNVDNTSDATKNSATATITNKTISGLNNTFSNIPNSALVNNSIGLTLNNSGSSPAVSTTPAALGTSLVLSIPFASGSNSGFLSNTFFTSFLGKVDSTSQSNDTVYDWHNGSATFRYVIVGGSGGIALLNGLSASTQTFATGTSGSDFNIVSAVSTHTFNFPNSSASNRGLLTSTDWSTFAAKQNAITPSNTIDQYWNGFENFVNLNTDSITEGTNHQFYTDARARAAISITTSGSSGPATYNNSTGVLNVPNYTGGSGTDTTTLVLPSLTRSTAGTIITLGLNVANANTWTALQTYNNNIALASNITFGTDNTYAIGTPTVGANAIYSRNVESDGILGLLTTASNPIIFAPNSTTQMELLVTGQPQFNAYTTSTSFTGTPVAFLQNDASGKVIQTPISSIQTALSNTPSGGFPLFNANSSAIRELFSGSNVVIDSTTHSGGYTINTSVTPLDTTTIYQNIRGKVDTSGQLGVIYNKNSWTSLSDFTDSTGGDVSIVANKLVFGTATGGDYKHTLNLAIPSTLFHWDMWVKFKVVVSSTGSTFGIGTRSINAAGGYHSLVSTTQTNTGANNGTIYLINLDAPGYTATTLNTPVAGQYSATNGGYVLMHVKRDMYTVTTYVRDYTNNTAEYTASYTYIDPGTTVFMPNAGTFSIYYLGGTFTVDSIAISSSETKNSNLLAMTDSKGGYQANTFQDSWTYQLGTKFGPVVPYWGGSDESTDAIPCLPYIKLLAPKQVIITPYSNDIRDGLLTAAQSDSNTARIYDSLTSWGIRVIFNKPFYETSIDLTPQKTFVESGRVGTNVIDTWTPMTVNGSLYSDGIHPSDLGHSRIYVAQVSSNLISRFSNQNEYYGSGFTNTAGTGIIPVSTGTSSIGPSFITQSGTSGVSAVENMAAQLIVSGAGASITFNNRSTNANTFSEYVPASGALAFQDDIGALIPFSVPENNGSTNPFGIGGFFKARPTGSSFPLMMSTDATGRGWVLVPNGSSYGSLANRGMLANVSTGYSGIQSFTTISTGVSMQLGLNPAGGKVLVNDTTSRNAGAFQVTSTTGPQLGLTNAIGDTVDFTVNSSASLGLTGLTGLTLPTSAIPAGSTADSSFVFETVAGVMTVKKALIAGGGSSQTLQQVLTTGSTLTGTNNVTNTGQTFTWTNGGTGLWKYSGISHDTTASFGLLGFANDSSVRAFSWAAVAAKVSPLLPTFTINTHNGLYASGGDSVGLGTNPLDQNTTINTAGFNFLIEGSLNVNASTSTAIVGPALTINGNVSATTSTSVRGYWINVPRANTFTEGSSGTLAQGETVFLGDETFAAGSATTYTNAATLFINGPPAAGANVTITYPWSIFVFAGNCFLGSNVSTFTGGSVSTTHILGNNQTGGGSAPSIAAGTGAGTSPTISITGTDMDGAITLTTGTTPAGTNATIATITFGYSFPTNTYVTLTPANEATAALTTTGQVYIGSSSTTNFILNSGTVGLTGATAYKWYYHTGGY